MPVLVCEQTNIKYYSLAKQYRRQRTQREIMSAYLPNDESKISRQARTSLQTNDILRMG
jgi:hypothetical protein